MKDELREVISLQRQHSAHNTPAMQRRGHLIRSILPGERETIADRLRATLGVHGNDLLCIDPHARSISQRVQRRCCAKPRLSSLLGVFLAAVEHLLDHQRARVRHEYLDSMPVDVLVFIAVLNHVRRGTLKSAPRKAARERHQSKSANGG